jgi:hypothetical protein
MSAFSAVMRFLGFGLMARDFGRESAVDADDADPSEAGSARSLLDTLLTNSRLYAQSKDYKDLLDFVVRLRHFAPFNAMLIQVQKPGFAISSGDLPFDRSAAFGLCGRWC